MSDLHYNILLKTYLKPKRLVLFEQNNEKRGELVELLYKYIITFTAFYIVK